MKPDLLKEFGRIVMASFKEALAHYGFKRELKETNKYSCKIIYGNGSRYIEIYANIHPRDYPPYSNIILGEGGRDFFESDWNSIALWRLKNYIQKEDHAFEYSLVEPLHLTVLLNTALDDLLKYGKSFLSGDLTLFYEVRANQNKDREPYKIHFPNKVGKYVTISDPMSTKLKSKFSKHPKKKKT
jgi:hypothetical protein